MGIEKFENPQALPTSVLDYERQNTQMYFIRTGLDTTAPYETNDNKVIIPAGGIFEMNGNLYIITMDNDYEGIVLNKTSTYAQWIAMKEVNGVMTASLVFRPGQWIYAKNGCYLADGSRTLNWVSTGTPNGTLGQDISGITQNMKNIYTMRYPRGWLYAKLTSGKGGGAGADGNDGGNSSSASAAVGGAGGVVQNGKTTNIVFFNDGKPLTIVIGANGTNGGSGGNGKSGVYGSGAGGGGGGGSGEATQILGIARTANIPAGSGGRGGRSKTLLSDNVVNTNGGNGGAGGCVGQHGANSENINTYGKGGNIGENGNEAYSANFGGGGGGGGINGEDRGNGVAGGYCYIYRPDN